MLQFLKGVVSPELVVEVRKGLEDVEFVDGKATALGPTRDIKHNMQAQRNSEGALSLGKRVIGALAASDRFMAAALPAMVMPPLFARYTEGMSYGEHLDMPVMGSAPGRVRTDVAITCFLSAADDYDGGELSMRSDFGERRVKGDTGDVVIYPASTLHNVQPVTRGERLVAVTWAQSMVRDPAKRRIVYDLAATATSLETQGGESAEAKVVRRCQYNLLRMWADV